MELWQLSASAASGASWSMGGSAAPPTRSPPIPSCCTATSHSLPIGNQLVQRRYEDGHLLQAAAAVAGVIDPES